MSPTEHERMWAVEDRHWWYSVLHGLVREQLQAKLHNGSRVLDVGCGTGGLMAQLKSAWDIWGVDPSKAALRLCEQRGLEQLLEASASELPFLDASFDAVLCLDVLYHREVDEQTAMAEITRVLKPGGLFIVNLPAFDCLRGAHDDSVSGVRRYNACKVMQCLTRYKLEIDMIQYWNAWLFLPLLVWRRLSRLRQSKGLSDLRHSSDWINDGLAKIGWFDARLCRRLQLPFGSSIFATARLRKATSHEG